MSRSISVILLYLIAFALLMTGYATFVAPTFEYMGMVWRPNSLKMAESVLLLIAVSAFLPSRFKRPSDLLLHFQWLFPFLPMLVLFGAQNQSRAFLYGSLLAFIILWTIANHIHLKPVRIVRFTAGTMQITTLLAAWSIIGAIMLLGGLRYLNFDLSKVYEIRSEAADSLPSIFGYLGPLVTKVLLPTAFLLALIKRRYTHALLAIAGSIMMFALTSHKSPVFYPLIVLGFFMVASSKRSILLLLSGYISVSLLSIFAFMAGGTGFLIGSLLMRRAYFVDAYNSYLYYDFFSQNSLVLWAQSKFSFGFVDYQYHLDSSHLLGQEYFNNPFAGINTGWVGSGYMNGGFAAMFLYAAVIGFILAIINSYQVAVDKRILVGISIVPLHNTFVVSDLPTALLTHGVIFMLLLFSLFAASAPAKKTYTRQLSAS